MKEKRLIHAYTEPKMELFRRSFYLLITTAGFILGTALIAGPVVLIITQPSVWLFLLFVLIPLGFWMNHRILRFTRKLRWQNRHLSSYLLFEHIIEATEWPTAYSTSPIKRKIPLKSVITVAAAPYIVRRTKTDHGTNQVITQTAPILFILYTEKGENRIVNIPFPRHDDPTVNVWLSHLKEKLVPIDFTARFLYRKNHKFMDDRERIKYIETSDEMMPFSFSGDWLTDYLFALEAWNERVKERQQKKEEENLRIKNRA